MRPIAPPPEGAKPGAPAEAPRAPPLFAAADDEWETELAAWDAAIPIVTRAPAGPGSPASSPPARPPSSAIPPGRDSGGVVTFGGPGGAVPGDENPFFETPTTVVSQGALLDLEDLPDVLSAATFDGGLSPASGSYAALVATDQSIPGIFDRDPEPEVSPKFPTEPLAEMSPRAWSEDLARLLTPVDSRRGALGAVGLPPRAYWETLARVLAEERSLTTDAERAVALDLAAARVADMLDDRAKAAEHLEAALAIDGASPAAHRARLTLSERAGGIDDAGAAESLARLALAQHPDQPYYRSLHAEWVLARASRGIVDGTAAAAVASLPDGLGRMLAEVELAWAATPLAAALLENAGHRVGGALGASLLLCAAGLNELTHDYQAAAEQRFVAARLDDRGSLVSLGVMRDLARLEPEAMVPALEDLITRLPPSPLKVALGRWGAAACRRMGDAARAWRMVSVPERLGPMTAGLARDRMDCWPGRPDDDGSPEVARSGGRAPPVREMVADVARFWVDPAAQVGAALWACEQAVREDDLAAAVECAASVVQAVPDAALLGPALEHVAMRARAGATRVRALRLWRTVDTARWMSASRELADALAEVPNAAAAPGGESVERVLSEIAAVDPTSAVFWTLASGAAAAGRSSDAATWIDRGIARPAWGASTLAAPLDELAAEYLARSDLAAAATRLLAGRSRSGPSPRPGASSDGRQRTLERILRQLADGDLWAEHVENEIAAAESSAPSTNEERYGRAALLLEPIFWRLGGPSGRPKGEDVPALTAAALDAVPLHPVALGLLLGTAPDAAVLAERLLAGAVGDAAPRWGLAAAIAAAASGDARRGLSVAVESQIREVPGAGSGSGNSAEIARAVGATIRRLAWAAPDFEARARLLRGLAGQTGAADTLVAAAEAAEALVGAAPSPVARRALRNEARRLFEEAALAPGAGVVSADVRVGLQRLEGSRTERARFEIGGTSASVDRRRPRDRLRLLQTAARAGRWDDVVADLAVAPPHEDGPGAQILSLAALLDEGRCDGNLAPGMWTDARAALNFGRGAVESAALLRAGAESGRTDPFEAGAALEHLAGAAAANADPRSAALFLVEAARLLAEVDRRQGASVISVDGADTVAERCLRAAVAQDPSSALAAMAWRRWLVRAGRWSEAAAACAAEADAFFEPASRVQALLRAADLSLETPAGDQAAAAHAAVAGRNHAAVFLARALDIDPRDQRAFSRLRDLYEEGGRPADLVRLLAARLHVTSNPFENTALRLARADIFAGPLADRARAKAELEAILQKEPQHARALGQLADLEQQDGDDAAAAALLVRRAFIERSPEKLRELFLRLGRIYTQRIPDPKRAVGAYARVLQLDANSHEALDELSRLYSGLGETKSAIAITERLVGIETDPERRARHHIRLAHLAERAGDPRVAAVHFRKAVDDAPQSVEALGELVRHLDKVRDVAGRRAFLDRACVDLRAAVLGNLADRSAIAALASVLRWRGRGAAAAAAVELLALAERAEGQDPVFRADAPAPGEGTTPSSGGRRLTALTKPAIDEDTFPSAVPPAVRQLFRLLVPVLNEAGRPDLGRLGVERADRVPPGRPPRDIFDAVAGELAAGPFELYLAPAAPVGQAARPPALIIEPGRPAAIVVGAALVQLGPNVLRFVAARALRLIATHLDVALSGETVDFGLWIGSVVRQFVPEHGHPDLPLDLLAARSARVARAIPRKLRQEIMPFAMESSGRLDLEAVRAGIRDGANRVGLLACGNLTTALRSVSLIAGIGSSSPSLQALATHPETQALLSFALSDAYDDVVKGLD